jgi:hypothetical protein
MPSDALGKRSPERTVSLNRLRFLPSNHFPLTHLILPMLIKEHTGVTSANCGTAKIIF